jgi:hypothetical protein
MNSAPAAASSLPQKGSEIGFVSQKTVAGGSHLFCFGGFRRRTPGSATVLVDKLDGWGDLRELPLYECALSALPERAFYDWTELSAAARME